jgi:cytidylate kinase
VAPLPIRIARTQEKFGITKDEAARRVKEFETARAEFVRSHFLKDVADVHQYDLVVNTERFSTAQCADLVVAALRQLESARQTQESRGTAAV